MKNPLWLRGKTYYIHNHTALTNNFVRLYLIYILFVHFFAWCSRLGENEGQEGNIDASGAVVIVDVSKGAPAVEGITAPRVANTPAL